MVTRSVLRPVTRSVTRPLFGGDSADPLLALFANGERGGPYKAWDLTTLAQDPDGSGSVSSDGTVVGRMTDVDGQTENNITQSTAAMKPTIQTDGSGYRYIQWDGTDDFLQSAAGIFPNALTELWFAVCVDTSNAAATNLICGVSDGAYSAGGANRWAALNLRSPSASSTSFSMNNGATRIDIDATTVAGTPSIIHGYWDGARAYLRVNGVDAGDVAFSPGATLMSQELDVGALDSAGSIVLESPIRLYGLVVRDKAPSASEIDLVEEQFAANSPVSMALW